MKPFRYLFSLFLIFTLSPSASASGPTSSPAPWEYNLGKGLRLAGSDFFVGGYLNTTFEKESDADGVFAIDDISFFVFGDLSQSIRFFSEIEDEESLEIDMDGEVETYAHWQVERLYLDFLYRENLNLRVGKFLTPVGTWNEIHAAPLTWTVSRPAVTIASYPESVTGIQLFGNLSYGDGDFSYTFSAQDNGNVSERTSFRKSHNFYGGRVKWFGPSGLEVAVPLLYYSEQVVDDDIYLIGLDFTFKRPLYEVRFEGNFSHVELKNGHTSREYGYYIQGVYSLSERLYLVLRHDYFHAREKLGDHKAVSLAAAYKLKPQIVFKLEGQMRGGRLDLKGDSHINNNERLLASFSVLF